MGAKVEHPFRRAKRQFGHNKNPGVLRGRGLDKNRQRLALLLGFRYLLKTGNYLTT